MASEWRRADAVLTGPVRAGRIDTYIGTGVHASMTDTTDPREGGSEHAELLADLEFYTQNDYRNPLQTRPATQAVIRNAIDAIRALEAKVAERNETVIRLGTQFNQVGTQLGKELGELRADRDRLAGEVEKFRSDRYRLAAKVETLRAELSAARENEARYLWLKDNAYEWPNGTCCALDQQERVAIWVLQMDDDIDAAIDAARRAGEGEA